jgi:hypothetical protein
VGAALERLSYYASVMLRTACAAFLFVCSVVRLLCAAEKRKFPLVFIASLQSPLSSVTQGPFLGRVLTQEPSGANGTLPSRQFDDLPGAIDLMSLHLLLTSFVP